MARPGIAPPPTSAVGHGRPREFKVEVVVEGALGTLFLGASKLPVARIEQVLNRYGAAGWELAFMLVESKRFLLFWQREAAVITFSRLLDG